MDYRRHLIIDGNNLLHMSIPYNPKDAVGPHMAAYNFLKGVSEWIRRTGSTSVIVCWDDGMPARRRELCPDYKKNRSVKTPKDRERFDDFGRNKEFLMGILPYFATRILSVPGFEADDLIYGLCAASSGAVSIVSGDLDMSQLVSDRVTLYRPGKQKINASTIGSLVLDEKYAVYPRSGADVVLFKALRGDPSDNIKPVMKPRAVCSLWNVMLAENLPPTVATAKALSERLGLGMGQDFDNHFAVVDLVRSGVAGAAIGHAVACYASNVFFNETVIFQKFIDIGIVPGYIHALSPAFQLLL